MVEVDGSTFGEGNAVTDLDSVVHDFGDACDVVISLKGLQDGLNGFDVSIQAVAGLLQFFDTVLVFVEFVPDGTMVENVAGDGQCEGCQE